MSDSTSAFAHATVNTATLDAIKEYCKRDVVLFWQPPSCFPPWTPSRSTVEGIPFSCGEQFFAAEMSGLFRDYQTVQHITSVSHHRLHEQYDYQYYSLWLGWGRLGCFGLYGVD